MANCRNGHVTAHWRFFTLIPHSAPLQGGSFDLRLRGRLKPQKFVLPQQILNKSFWHVYTCLGSPLPVVVTTNIIKIIAGFVSTLGILLHPTFKKKLTTLTIGGRVGQPFKTCYNACEVCPILNSHHLAQALACDSVPALCSLYNSRVGNPRLLQMPSWEDWCIRMSAGGTAFVICRHHVALIGTSSIELLIRKYPLRICQVARGSRYHSICCIHAVSKMDKIHNIVAPWCTLFNNLRCGCIEWTKSRNWSSICKLVWLVMNE